MNKCSLTSTALLIRFPSMPLVTYSKWTFCCPFCCCIDRNELLTIKIRISQIKKKPSLTKNYRMHHRSHDILKWQPPCLFELCKCFNKEKCILCVATVKLSETELERKPLASENGYLWISWKPLTIIYLFYTKSFNLYLTVKWSYEIISFETKINCVVIHEILTPSNLNKSAVYQHLWLWH